MAEWPKAMEVCSQCGEKVERELHGDNRWACPVHGNGITYKWVAVVPENVARELYEALAPFWAAYADVRYEFAPTVPLSAFDAAITACKRFEATFHD
jgi:hypothetical protein